MTVLACVGVLVAGFCAGFGFDSLIRVSSVAAVGCVIFARCFYLALLSLRAKKLARARLDVERDPANPLVHHALAMRLYDKGDIHEALHAFINSVELDPALSISREREALSAVLATHARTKREREAARHLMRLASIGFLFEQARRRGWTVPQDCKQALDSIRAELSGLEVMRGELGSFVSGSEYYEDNLLIEREMNKLREKLERIEELMRHTEED